MNYDAIILELKPVIIQALQKLGEEKIDIWKNKKTIIKENSSSNDGKDKKPNLDFSTTLKAPEKIEIQEGNEKIILSEYKKSRKQFDEIEEFE